MFLTHFVCLFSCYYSVGSIYWMTSITGNSKPLLGIPYISHHLLDHCLWCFLIVSVGRTSALAAYITGCQTHLQWRALLNMHYEMCMSFTWDRWSGKWGLWRERVSRLTDMLLCYSFNGSIMHNYLPNGCYKDDSIALLHKVLQTTDPDLWIGWLPEPQCFSRQIWHASQLYDNFYSIHIQLSLTNCFWKLLSLWQTHSLHYQNIQFNV